MRSWLLSFSRDADVNEWTFDETLGNVDIFLDGIYQLWFRHAVAIGRITTWEDFIKLFVERFESEITIEGWKRQYDEIKQMPNESVTKFSNRFIELACKAGVVDELVLGKHFLSAIDRKNISRSWLP